MAAKQYRVHWEIDIWAGSARQAARCARQIQLDPENTATVFEVVDFGSEKKTLQTVDILKSLPVKKRKKLQAGLKLEADNLSRGEYEVH